MSDWFRQLQPREQIVLTIAALLAVVVIGWNFIWAPLQLRSADLAGSVTARTELVVNLKRAAGLNVAVPGGAPAAADTSLTVIINLTAEPLGFGAAIERSSPVSSAGGGDAIRVSLRAAPFDTLVSWLDTLERQHGVTVATADIARTAQAGVVNGQIVLERS